MPELGNEVYLTELEVEVLQPFIKRMLLRDETIANSLRVLIDKLTKKPV